MNTHLPYDQAIADAHIRELQDQLRANDTRYRDLELRCQANAVRELNGNMGRSFERDRLARALNLMIEAAQLAGGWSEEATAPLGMALKAVRKHYNAHGWPDSMFFIYQVSGDTDGEGIKPMKYSVRKFSGPLSEVKEAVEMLNSALEDGGDVWVYSELDPR